MFKTRPRYLLTYAFLLLSCQTVVAADNYQLKVVAEDEDAIYQVGDEARFIVTLTLNGAPVAGTVNYAVDDFLPAHQAKFPSGTLDLSASHSIAAKLDAPGFLKCLVTFQTPENKKMTAITGVAFSPTEIPLSLPVPADFDAFWSAQKQQLANVAMDPQLTPVEHADQQLDCFDVQVACLGDAPVSGYFGKPKGAKPKSLPAILWVHGAGVRSSSLPNAVKGAQAGMLSMDINAHGLPNGKPNEFYQAETAGRLKDYRYAGRDSRDTSYFRGMFLRLVRAIDFLTAQPEWDGRTVIVIGHSQGGGQALVAGGLDPRVTFIATGVPAICDHSGRAADRINGWPKLVPDAANGEPDPQVLEASRYVDAVNFASRCRADAMMSIGFIDTVCPPSSCYAAYNQLQGNKHALNEPSMGHAAPPHIHEAFFNAALEHVQSRKSAE